MTLPSPSGHTPDFVELLSAWPNLAVIAGDLGLAYSTVRSWVERNHVPTEWHDDLVRSAKARRVSVSATRLAAAERSHQEKLRSRKRRRPRSALSAMRNPRAG